MWNGQAAQLQAIWFFWRSLIKNLKTWVYIMSIFCDFNGVQCFPFMLWTPCRASSHQSISFHSRCHIFLNGCFVLWGWKLFMCSIDVGKHYLAISLSSCHSIGKTCFKWKDDLLSSLPLTVRVCVHKDPQSSYCYFQRKKCTAACSCNAERPLQSTHSGHVYYILNNHSPHFSYTLA